MPHPDLEIDIAPVLRWQRGAEALGLSPVPDAAGFRQAMEEGGIDPARAAVAYLEALVSGALEVPVDRLDAETAGRVLLAEEVLLVLTGSDDLETVRTWLSSPPPGA